MQNAIIESVSLTLDGPLTAWLNLRYGGSACQSFGGFALHLPPSFDHYSKATCAGEFIMRCMQIAGVTEWSQMPGKAIRVRREPDDCSGKIVAIGHIINDDWFNPSTDLKP